MQPKFSFRKSALTTSFHSICLVPSTAAAAAEKVHKSLKETLELDEENINAISEVYNLFML